MRRSCCGGGERTSVVASGGVIGGIHSPWIRNPVPWETCYRLFRTWQRDGTWAHTLTKLQAARTRRA